MEILYTTKCSTKLPITSMRPMAAKWFLCLAMFGQPTKIFALPKNKKEMGNQSTPQ